jgi:hypothetical protein
MMDRRQEDASEPSSEKYGLVTVAGGQHAFIR